MDPYWIKSSKEYDFAILSQTVFDYHISKAYSQDVFAVTVCGNHSTLLRFQCWEPFRCRLVKSDEHEGLWYHHYVDSHGVDCRLIIDERYSDEEVFVIEGHAEK